MVVVHGINHVALDVPDLDRAVEFYRDVFDMALMRRSETGAWLDCRGRFDFLALFEDPGIDPEDPKDGHWGLVVDDLEEVRRRAKTWNVEFYPDFECDFRDPFGYRVQVIRQADVSKKPAPYEPGSDSFDGEV